MNIGSIIKKLRRERDMTQEQLAEYLNISVSAVSQWESEKTAPDISMLAPLANIFNVSSDTLLGIDITLKKEHIAKIENEASNYLYKGKYEEAEKILRSALKEYPNSYELMSGLANTLANIAYHDKARQETLREEEILLSEKILSECTDDEIRYNTILRLCQAYCKIGKNEKAMDLANKMPHKSASKDSLLGGILKGTEKFKHNQMQIAHDMSSILRQIMYLNDSPIDGEIKPYNLDEHMSLYHKIIDIINILCEDGNFGNFNSHLSDVYLRLYYSNLQKKDNDAALKNFKLATKFAIHFDAIPKTTDVGTDEYSCLLFKGVYFGIMKYISPKSRSQFLFEIIESENFHSRFPSVEIDAIREDLQKSARHQLI